MEHRARMTYIPKIPTKDPPPPWGETVKPSRINRRSKRGWSRRRR